MELVKKLAHAIAAKDTSRLAEFKAEAEPQFARLRASGQKNYIKTVQTLLSELEEIDKAKNATPKPTAEQIANSPKAITPNVDARIKAQLGDLG